MPGVGMHCLNHIQPIVGCDGHRTIPPPIPTPPFAPHVVVYMVGLTNIAHLPTHSGNSKAEGGKGYNGSCGDNPVQCGWGYAVGRQHDAGAWVVHIWPNALLPLILLGAGNKCEFASGTVKLKSGDMAIAVAYAVNFQLDCWDFPCPPLPTSVAIAAANTVFAGFTAADFWGGFFGMVFDMAFTWAVNGVCNLLGNALGKLLSKGLSGLTCAIFKDAVNFNWVSASFAPTAAHWLSTDMKAFWIAGFKTDALPALAGYALGTFGIGSPLGYSSPKSIFGASPLANVNQNIHDYFDPPPNPSK